MTKFFLTFIVNLVKAIYQVLIAVIVVALANIVVDLVTKLFNATYRKFFTK